jgi:Subtilisin inhibitor-like
MRRLLVVVAPVLVSLVAGASPFAATVPTALRITYWEDSARPSATVTWTLRCHPARGTLPRPVRACARLVAGGAKLFAPLPKNVVCTEIYGGPQKARIVGTVEAKRVWATFARSNGCEIDRWQRLSPWLLPPGGIT